MADERLQLTDTSGCPVIMCSIGRFKMIPSCVAVGFVGTSRLGVTQPFPMKNGRNVETHF